MHVRLAEPRDAESVRRIYNAEVVGSTATFDLRPRTPEEQAAWMDDHRGTYPVVVAVDDEDRVLGFGSLSTYRDRPSYATTVEDSVYVDTTHRGNGVGRALLEELVRLATLHGFHSMIARIGGDNTASIALHQACGFEEVGVEREIGRKFNRWLDVAVLQRMLGGDGLDLGD
ncbi:MAG TPA: GNAT family N-acetyltransferase [Acidimicrobiales bacterium]|nr:GNAT family N-acetyltransferase [Acidimicrobiales bacterium]